jgi:hypothetical protein
MALSEFADKSRQPTDDDLAATLGQTFDAWIELKALVVARYPQASSVWAFGGKSIGWGLRLKVQDRIILYMTPCQNHFLVSFVLGERAVKAAHASGLPAAVLSSVDSAKKYAEGRGVRFEIRTIDEIRHMATLATIKMAN